MKIWVEKRRGARVTPHAPAFSVLSLRGHDELGKEK